MTRRTLTRLVALVALVAMLQPLAAGAKSPYNWSFGGSSPFGGAPTDVVEKSAGSSYALRLTRQVTWEMKLPTPFNPRSVQVLPNEHVLVADGDGIAVREYDRNREVVWSYTKSDDSALKRPFDAQRLDNGNTLIVDRTSYTVLEVDRSKHVVWRYGTGAKGLAPGQLTDPFSAVRLKNGNTLICDNRGASRVIEVRSKDYSADKPNLGYTAASIVWKYGTDGVTGKGPGKLASPRLAQRLANGNTLITDADNHYVLEVTPAGKKVWSFGVEGEALPEGTPPDDTHLLQPCAAYRLSDGRTLIVDTTNDRLLWVGADGRVLDRYGTGGESPSSGPLNEPRGASFTSDGKAVIADEQNGRLIEVGYARSGRWLSDTVDLGTPGVKKWLTEVALTADTPKGSSLAVSFSCDGQPFQPAFGSTLPVPPQATTVRLLVSFMSTNANVTPVLRSGTVGYSLTKPKKAPTGGGTGSKTGKKDKNGKTQATSDTSNTEAIVSGTGTTSGTGSTGGGSGSGTGGGTGTGAGTGTGKTAPGATNGGGPRIPGTAPGPGQQTTGQLLERITSQDTGPGWKSDPEAKVGSLNDPVGTTVGLAMMALAFITGIFGDALGVAVRPVLRTVIATLMSWREA